jgi:hypothetical protein
MFYIERWLQMRVDKLAADREMDAVFKPELQTSIGNG